MWMWLRRYTHPDELIDELILKKGARPVAGMANADWQTINRVGAARWRETVRAQAKTGQRDPHSATGPHLVNLRKAG